MPSDSYHIPPEMEGVFMKNKAAVTLGRRGGRARAKNLTPEELSAIGRHGARIRWKKAKGKNEDRKNSE